MSKSDPKFWEISISPQILESVLVEPDFIEKMIGHGQDQELAAEKERLKLEAIAEIRAIIGAHLTVKQRRIVELYFFERRTQQEIARELGLPQQVVSKHLFGAMREGRKVGGAIAKIRKVCLKLGIDPQKWV